MDGGMNDWTRGRGDGERETSLRRGMKVMGKNQVCDEGRVVL